MIRYDLNMRIVIRILLFLGYSLTSFSALGNNCKIQEQILGTSFQVKITQYLNDSATNTILIIPPTGGSNFLDKSYGKTFCENGMNAIILNNWTDDNEYNLDLEIHQRFYGRAQKAIEIVLNSVQTAEVGILGTSVGAIHASVATSLFDRIQKAFLITGGAPIAEVIAKSEQNAMEDAKRKRFEIHQFKNEDDYAKALDKVIFYDPFKLEQKFKGKKLGMIVGLKDTVVPYKNQKALQDLWQPQTLIEYNNNHLLSILGAWLFRKSDIVHFFKS